MANIDGGVTGRPSGKLANIVFGAARTREGKQVTARELVKPSNPQTTAQQNQRSSFSSALDIVKAIGPSIYQEDWNRAVGQLPGFQSLQSIFLNNLDGNQLLTPPPDTPLGNLHFPDTWSADPGASNGEIDFTWSTETPGAATGQDTAVVFGMCADPMVRDNTDPAYTLTTAQRTDGAVSLPVVNEGQTNVVALYFRADQNDAPPLSLAAWDETLSG